MLFLRSLKFTLSTSLVILCTCILTNCTLYKKPVVPKLQIPSHFKNAPNILGNKISINTNQWWQNFNDPELNQLVNLALKNNLNYKIALKNIAIAKTYITENTSDLFPQINLNYNLSRTAFSNNGAVANQQNSGQGKIFNLNQLDATVSYEIDVWHQVANSVNQAKSDTQSSAANSRVIQLSLISAVVNTYFQINALGADINSTKEELSLAKDNLKLLNSNYRGGLVDIGSVDDAKTQLESIQSNLSSLEKQKQTMINTLAYLIGEYPENFNLKIKNTLTAPISASLIPQSLPSQILTNRPDIEEAFYQILSYGYFEKQSLANFFPAFSLTGTYGYASSALKNFISKGSLLWDFGLNMIQPLFDYQKRASQHQRAKLQYEAAVLNYKDVVLNSFKEVDTALVSYQKDQASFIASERQLWATKEKLDLAYAQYKSGFNDYATYLNYRINFLQAKYNSINQKLAVLSDIVQIYKTFGLGVN